MSVFFFFFQAEDGIRDHCVTGVQTCALPISASSVHDLGGKMVWVCSCQKMLMPRTFHLGKMPCDPPPAVSSNTLLCEGRSTYHESIHGLGGRVPGALQGKMAQMSSRENSTPVSSSALLCEDPKA